MSVLKASELFKAVNDQALLLDSLGHGNIRSWETGRKELNGAAAAGYQVFLGLNLQVEMDAMSCHLWLVPVMPGK